MEETISLKIFVYFFVILTQNLDQTQILTQKLAIVKLFYCCSFGNQQNFYTRKHFTKKNKSVTLFSNKF